MINKNTKGLASTSEQTMTNLESVVRRIAASVMHGSEGLVDVSGVTADDLNKSTKLVSSIARHEVVKQLRGAL